MGVWVRVIFWMFRGFSGLVWVFLVPNTIPHYYHAPLVHNHTVMHYLRLICTKTYINIKS